jgi:hypothetical protein
MQDLLPAGGLRLYREGVEPSGPLRKVSGYIHPPSQDFACRKVSSPSKEIRQMVPESNERFGPAIPG